MTPEQKKLTRKHGTPNQFENACWQNVPFVISALEAQTAIQKYHREWMAAGKKVGLKEFKKMKPAEAAEYLAMRLDLDFTRQSKLESIFTEFDGQ